MVIPLLTQVTAAAVCKCSGLVLMQTDLKLVTKYLSLMAYEVQNILSSQRLAVTMSNIRDKPTRLVKGTMMGISMPASATIMGIDTEEFLHVGSLSAK